MSRTLIKLTGLEGNGIGTNAQPIPANLDAFALHIALASGTCLIGDYGLVTLYGGTDPLHQYLTGADLDLINQYDKGATYLGNNMLRLNLERLGLKDVNQTYGTTLKINPPLDGNNQGSGVALAKGLPAGTPVFTSGKLEFVVAATAVNPKFVVYAEVERDIDLTKGAGSVMRRKRFQETLNGATEQGFSKWDFGNKKNRYIRRVFLANSGGTIDNVRVLGNGAELFNRTRQVNAYVQNQYGFHTQVAGFPFVIDFTENGIGEDLDTLGLGSLEYMITPSAAGTLSAYVEYGGVAF